MFKMSKGNIRRLCYDENHQVGMSQLFYLSYFIFNNYKI